MGLPSHLQTSLVASVQSASQSLQPFPSGPSFGSKAGSKRLENLLELLILTTVGERRARAIIEQNQISQFMK